jgi:CheY-like chemotaxis protein
MRIARLLRRTRPGRRSDGAEGDERTRAGLVLLVDDDPSVRRVTRRMLEHCGWRVREAVDGQAAVDSLIDDHDEIRCVVLDRLMPGMDGERTFLALRGLRPDLPVVMVSAQPDPELIRRLSCQEGVSFVDKPFRLSELDRQVQRFVYPSGALVGA